MGNQLTLIDKRTNGQVIIQVSPNMTIDEVTQILREHGIIRPGEMVVYGRIREDGAFRPLAISVVEDLLALQARGQRIGFVAHRLACVSL